MSAHTPAPLPFTVDAEVIRGWLIHGGHVKGTGASATDALPD